MKRIEPDYSVEVAAKKSEMSEADRIDICDRYLPDWRDQERVPTAAPNIRPFYGVKVQDHAARIAILAAAPAFIEVGIVVSPEC